MCVILDISPGATVPDDKLATACDINKHGFGIAYVDNHSVKIIRSLVQPNDPEVVQKHLNSLKGKRRFLHLRHATVGDVSEDNNHPLVVLGDKKKTSLVLMHNGTLQKYKVDKDPRSDTFFFNQNLVQPLAERIEAFAGAKGILTDGIFKYILTMEAGYSLFLLADAFGNVLRVGDWETYDGFFASNKYSFQSTHHRSSNKPSYNINYRSQTYRRDKTELMPWLEVVDSVDEPAVLRSMEDWDKIDKASEQPKYALGLNITAAVPYTSNPLGYRRELLQLRRYLSENKREDNDVSIVKNLKVKRTSFLESVGQRDLSFLQRLTTDDLKILIERYPLAMSQCLFELVSANASLEAKNATQAATLTDLLDKAKANANAG